MKQTDAKHQGIPAGEVLPEYELRLLLDHMISPFSYCMMLYDENGVAYDYIFIAVNQAFEKETGLAQDQVVGKRASEIFPSTEQFWMENFGRIGKSGIARRIINYSSAMKKWYEVSAYSPKPDHVAVTVLDVSDSVELTRNRKEIRDLAYLDANTRLPNQNQLTETFETLLENDVPLLKKYALIYIGLKNFDDICASYGSAVSDQLLQLLAKRISTCECEKCELYHLSGSNFLLLIDQNGNQHAIQASVDAITLAISNPLEVMGNYFRLEAYCGISLYPQDGSYMDELLMKANIAYHWAKRSGKGTFANYNPAMGLAMQRKSKMRNYLHRALENQELHLHYQPQVDSATLCIKGFEALLR